MTTTFAALALLPTIWVVDASNGPGTNFTSLPAAVAAAQSGDTLLVRPGSYGHFGVTGKALSIRGAGATTTFVEVPFFSNVTLSATVVGAVPAGQTFFVDGVTFRVAAPPPPGGTADVTALKLTGGDLVLSDVTAEAPIACCGYGDTRLGLDVVGGVAHAQRCVFAGGGAFAFTFNPATGSPGVRVKAGAQFSADGCAFFGGDVYGSSFFGLNRGGSGLDVAGGSATVYASSFVGGDAAGSSTAAAGVNVAASGFARIAGSAADVLQGGVASVAANAGPAIAVAPGASAVLHGPLTLVAGSPLAPAVVGAAVVGAPLPRMTLTGVADANGELDANQSVVLTADGVLPNAPFLLALHVVPAYSTAYAAFVYGETLLPVETAILLPGDLDATASWTLPMNPSLDAPALVGSPFYLQMFVLDAAASNLRASSLLKILYRN